MPDKRKHRGKNPEDDKLFSPSELVKIFKASEEYSWLLTRNYPEAASLKLVGDQYFLKERQRLAVRRISCGNDNLLKRVNHEISPDACNNKHLFIDGYNLLIGLEAALSQAYLFEGRDGCLRDLSGIHGSYKKVEETIPALTIIGNFFKKLNLSDITWFLDEPVSNSGRLKSIMMDLSREQNWNWNVQLEYSPDKVLIHQKEIIVTSDGIILDNVKSWCNALKWIIKELNNTQIINYSVPADEIRNSLFH